MPDQKMTDNAIALELETFLPYRLATLSTRISQAISKYYIERYQITVTEWRVIAVLGVTPEVSAGYIGQVGTMDKVAVSRAVNKLLESGYILREFSEEDKRRSILKLSEDGWGIYNEIVPLAKKYEDDILKEFTATEHDALESILTKLETVQLSLSSDKP
ncbi:MarR family winged helix-turn-helix transcriptional regulator [Temperatibacter marinus]|uniref:MarR family winged helix-turn-helix transcriptional regulator n=1 Tax=Temperatibacter marinus TaxID=1456591 RepID=A0AA52EH93_9PROT|nr:MarR family winged helix-turn-helix transcriptional regulator [Temperatibacter marinus]WND02036.1 MarR family winged helix-turn-helix transcriptional regulator [Temperatibacter marinus]